MKIKTIYPKTKSFVGARAEIHPYDDHDIWSAMGSSFNWDEIYWSIYEKDSKYIDTQIELLSERYRNLSDDVKYYLTVNFHPLLSKLCKTKVLLDMDLNGYRFEECEKDKKEAEEIIHELDEMLHEKEKEKEKENDMPLEDPKPIKFTTEQFKNMKTLTDEDFQPDMVNHPPHYNVGGFEVIDIIKAFTQDLNGIAAVDTGNAIKYILRWHNKNGVEDLKKAKWYIEHLIKTMEEFEEIKGTISNERLWAKGSDTPEQAAMHMDNVSKLEARLNELGGRG